MYLIEQKPDGSRFAATPNDIRSYSKALADARAHFRLNKDTVALYLYNDGGSHVVRTYFRDNPANHDVDVMYGYHEWPKPPTFYPGALPERPDQATSRLHRHASPFDVYLFSRNMGKTAQAEALRDYYRAVWPGRFDEPARLCGYTIEDIRQLADDKARLSSELAEARSSLQHEHDALVSLKAGLRDLVSRFTA
jgi:hypothetical protein